MDQLAVKAQASKKSFWWYKKAVRILGGALFENSYGDESLFFTVTVTINFLRPLVGSLVKRKAFVSELPPAEAPLILNVKI